ncbi:MAG: 50S ribosomal protein L22 [Pyrinomonadaceae bacterium MAG19_C2-C3]|nr:50S ribosomal protein L22 [Pyrinomonadaceae bacterium MAG19_C2-C3]
MEAKASAKFIRGSAQKARLVVDLVRGKSVNQALATLQFTYKRASNPVEACVRSAIANATEAAERANIAVDPDDLWIKEAFVDKGPTKSRFRTRPAPQGRAFRERRHFCHVTITLSSDEHPDTLTRNGNAEDALARRAARQTIRQSIAASATRQRSEQETATTTAAVTTGAIDATPEAQPVVTATENTDTPQATTQTETAQTTQATQADVTTETQSSSVETAQDATSQSTDATTNAVTENKTEEKDGV